MKGWKFSPTSSFMLMRTNKTLEVAEMMLAGKLNGEIVNSVNQTGVRAVVSCFRRNWTNPYRC